MVLAAWELGLGTCWVGAFSEAEVKKLLGVPDGIRVVQLLTLGPPAEVPEARPRKALDEIVHYEKWGGRK